MNFVTEMISVKDQQRVGFEKLRTPIGRPLRPYKWTVDRENNVFLVRVWQGREESFEEESFVLGWGDFRINAHTIYKIRESDEGQIITWNLNAPLTLPLELETKRKEILLAFKGALTSDFFDVGKAHALEFDF